MDLFKDIIPNILEKKEPLEFEEDDWKEYKPFLINQGLSHHFDCIFLVNEMNKNWQLSKQMQYDFLFHSISKKKRKFQPWVRKEKKDSDLELVKKYFNYSTEKAKEIINILTKNDLEYMQSFFDEGGMLNNGKTTSTRKNG